MSEYGQFCPVAKASDILGERWTVLILRELLLGTTRFNDLQRGLSRISPTLLSKTLEGAGDKRPDRAQTLTRARATRISADGLRTRARADHRTPRRMGHALGAWPDERERARCGIPDVGPAASPANRSPAER